MRPLISIVALLVLAAPASAEWAQVIRVVDGDTFNVRLTCKQFEAMRKGRRPKRVSKRPGRLTVGMTEKECRKALRRMAK